MILRYHSNVLVMLSLFALFFSVAPESANAQQLATVEVDGQPLAENARRLVTALEYLGAPLDRELATKLDDAIDEKDSAAIQSLLDPLVLFEVSINPELRVKVDRGPGEATIQQHGFVPTIVKVVNDGSVTAPLNVQSPQSGPRFAGVSELILQRQAQTELISGSNDTPPSDRFLQVEVFRDRPMTPRLSGLRAEYVIVLFSSSESGKRDATIGFDVGGGTQDIDFRGEAPVLLDVKPAHAVRLNIKDHDGKPATARLLIRDPYGRVYPSQVKRVAPDFFFQPHIYRADGEVILLPKGTYSITSCRGPEYYTTTQEVRVTGATTRDKVNIRLVRWVDPSAYGFFSGDHHIHGAGCSHYESPTQGVTPQDMFRQVKGEGLNVGCVLTWGPCFDFQRQYFSPTADLLSEPFSVLKYDLEISGFGSAALGHVCLLNLENQTYPGSDGTSTKGWPTWTVPVMRWAKEQGGFTGYPHSAMPIDAEYGSATLLQELDQNQDSLLDEEECKDHLLPFDFAKIDRDQDKRLSQREIKTSLEVAATELPNFAIPDMSGAGAMEIFVSAADGCCDFISAMDTARTSEWNTWYHLMNCGLPIKLSGETDFPCMSSRRVGQGRVYVKLGDVEKLDFTKWSAALAEGRSYVSDGYAHALDFEVEGVEPGLEPLRLREKKTVNVSTTVCFAPQVPKAVAYGTENPSTGKQWVGDTVNLHAPRNNQMLVGGLRLVELVVNGQVVAKKEVAADGKPHDLTFEVLIEQSSWIALRQFPQLHTNPVQVLVNDEPIRASAKSALWCKEATIRLWERRNHFIAEAEREDARAAYDRAIELYSKIAAEAESR